ncbi:MAG: cyclic nucleotide-binding domain-containing protein [Oligoflexales bacterium]
MRPLIVMLILAFAGAALIFHFVMRSHGRRKGDTVKLKGYRKKIFKHAERLLKEGNALAGAQLLESIGMHREAVNVLEEGKFVREAAGVLLRIGRPGRAAYIFARHGLWKNAADCFELAKMPLEVARCAREAGDIEKAAKNYHDAGQLLEAAECYVEIGQHREAARIYAEVGEAEKAIELYQSIVENSNNIQQLDFNEKEIQIITNYLKEGHSNVRFADILVSKNKLLEVLFELVSSGKVQTASEIYLRSTFDIGPQLIAHEGFAQGQLGNLAKLFQLVSNFEYAGRVYETLQSFDQAGECFERAEDFERAAAAFEKAGFRERALDARVKVATYGKRIDAEDVAPAAKEAPPDTDFFTESKIIHQGAAPSFKEEDTMLIGGEKNDVDGPTDFGDISRLLRVAGEFSSSPSADEEYVVADHDRSPFHKSEFLSELDFQQKNLMWSIGKIEEFDAGDVILHIDDDPKGVYFLLSGVVSCQRATGEELSMFRAPATFGEFWLLVDMPSQVKFICRDKCRILVVERKAFDELLDKNGTIARKLYKRFTRRLVEKFLSEQNLKKLKSVS